MLSAVGLLSLVRNSATWSSFGPALGKYTSWLVQGGTGVPGFKMACSKDGVIVNNRVQRAPVANPDGLHLVTNVSFPAAYVTL